MTLPIFLAHPRAASVKWPPRQRETFGFAWWFFLSQCISFVIVAWLLHRFAYQPDPAGSGSSPAQIEEGLANAEKIKVQLAEAQQTSMEIIQRANGEAQKMIEDARASAKALGERQAQQAVAEAEQIITKPARRARSSATAFSLI
jgi:F-type H+-transporting ATPase subunit b